MRAITMLWNRIDFQFQMFFRSVLTEVFSMMSEMIWIEKNKILLTYLQRTCIEWAEGGTSPWASVSNQFVQKSIALHPDAVRRKARTPPRTVDRHHFDI